jgi:hypothetical protein
VVLLALLLSGSVGRAADTALVLKGRVIDENGLPVGGAQVRLEHAVGQATPGNVGQAAPGNGGQAFSAVSDDAGFFSFPNLSPGEYTVRIEKQGYFVLADQKIHLAAESSEFAFTLNHEEEVREKVDVTVTENRIDPSTTQSTETLTGTEIRDIPVASTHDLQQSLVAMPQVVKDNSNLIHIAGARNTQAQYLLDGVEVGDPASGGLTARMIVEAVRSVEIQTGRFGAEYAHPGAAVMSYETREGDDRWRFGATDFIPGISIQNGVQFGNFYPRVVFSGPIVKDQLWFSQSFDVLHTVSIVKGLPPGAPDEGQQWGGDSWSRLLWKISTNNSLHVSFLSNNESDGNVGLDALDPQSTTTNGTTNRLFGSVKEQSYFQKTLFEIGLGVERTTFDSTPQGTAPYVLLVNGAEGNYFQKLKQESHRYQAFSDAISAPLHWFGTHTISGGGNLSSVDFSQTAQRGEIQALRSDQTLDRLTTFTGNPSLRVANTLAGGFVQDSWSPNKHVVAQIGVRVDWDRLFQSALAQPRVALNWMPFVDNRGKFSIGWGMYNIPLNLSVIGQTYDQQQVDTLYDPTGTVAVQGPATSRFVLPPSGLAQLQQPYFDIASAGYQQKIGENTIMSLELLARDQHHGLVYETLSPGQIGSDFLLQSSRRDKYRGATISARHTFANSAVLFGSYTRSRASSDQVLDPTLGAMYFAAQQPGPLLWDAPNRLLSWGSTPTPLWGILFTYLFDYRTGYPYSEINQQQFLIGAANARRFPDYASLTIGLEKKFTFSHRVFAARLVVVNILSRQNPDVVVNNIDAPNFGTFSGGQGRAVTARLRFVGRK